MRYVKVFGPLVAVAASALMMFAGSASATTITSPTGTAYTGTLTSTSTNTEMHGSFVTLKCGHAHSEFTIEQHGPGLTVRGKVKTQSFTECNYAVTVTKPGEWEIHAVNAAGGTCSAAEGDKCTGTITSTGTEFSIATSVGTCVFSTVGTDTGTITPTPDTGATAIIDTNNKIPRTGGNFLCGASGTITGSATLSVPHGLWIDEN